MWRGWETAPNQASPKRSRLGSDRLEPVLFDPRSHELLDERHWQGFLERKMHGRLGGLIGCQFLGVLLHDRRPQIEADVCFHKSKPADLALVVPGHSVADAFLRERSDLSNDCSHLA